MNDEADKKALGELTRMAIAYMDRGNLDKATELMHLAEKISRRLSRSNVIEMNDWQHEPSLNSKDARA